MVSCIWRVSPVDSIISLISACIDSGIRVWDARSGQPQTVEFLFNFFKFFSSFFRVVAMKSSVWPVGSKRMGNACFSLAVPAASFVFFNFNYFTNLLLIC